VNAKDFFPRHAIRLVDDNLSIKPTRSQQGRVEHVGPIGGGHDDDALV